MKGMMVQDGLTMDDALKLMEEGEKTPNRPAPKLPPKLLGMLVTSSLVPAHPTMFCILLFLHFQFWSAFFFFFFFLQWCPPLLLILTNMISTMTQAQKV